jgi:hypothetical protein
MGEYTVKTELNYGIIDARANYYRTLYSCDRFDGNPNFDDYRGAEAALRSLAERLGVEVVDDEKTRLSAIAMLEFQYDEAGIEIEEEMVEFFEMVREGREDEWEV